MKRDKVSTFLKSKGFYVSLFSGIFAVFALTMVFANQNSITAPDDNVQEQVETPGETPGENLAEAPAGTPTEATEETPGETPGELAGLDPAGEGAIGVIPDAQGSQQDTADNSDAAEANEEVAAGPELESEFGEVSEPATSVTENQNALQNLHFQEDKGLLWPAEGAIIKNYSVEKLVYFDTLDQYKINPAVMIGLEAGSEVLCGAQGVVTAITETEELGHSVLIDIGDGYQLRYAQLQDMTVQVGDMVEEGQVLAQVAEPTIYYTEEGSNLYFQVLQDGETVNPLLLLR